MQNTILGMILSLLIFFNAYLFRRIIGSWVNPPVIYSLFWFGYTIFPLVMVNQLQANSASILYILIFCVCFSSSALMFNWGHARIANSNKLGFDFNISIKTLHLSFIGLTIIATTFVIVGTVSNLPDIFSMKNLIEINARYTDMRYSNEVKSNFFTSSALIITYLNAILGGFVSGCSHSLKRYVKLLIISMTFMPSLMIVLLQGSKGMILLSLFFYLGAYLVTQIYKNNFTLLDKSRFKNLLVGGGALIIIMTIAFYSRGIYKMENEQAYITIMYYFNSYINGHLYAFSDWFSHYIDLNSVFQYKNSDMTYGFISFMSIFQLLGDGREVPMGTYSEFITYEGIIKTNIYTVYRGLITDFGIFGSLIYAFVSGLIINSLYYRLLTRKFSPVAIISFIFFIVYSYISFGISLATWKNMILIYFLAIILLYLFSTIRRVKV